MSSRQPRLNNCSTLTDVAVKIVLIMKYNVSIGVRGLLGMVR